MKIPRASEPGGELINISSLVDVMFILIIFFLATTTFQREERDVAVNLPDGAQGESASSAPKMIVVNVRADGTYLLASEVVEIDDLQGKVAEAYKDDPTQKVLVRGDRKAFHGHVAAAVLACRNAGVAEANLGYQIPE